MAEGVLGKRAGPGQALRVAVNQKGAADDAGETGDDRVFSAGDRRLTVAVRFPTKDFDAAPRSRVSGATTEDRCSGELYRVCRRQRGDAVTKMTLDTIRHDREALERSAEAKARWT